MGNNYNRRRLLQRGGLVGVVLLAGCSSDGTGEPDQDTDTPTRGSDSATTTAATETEPDSTDTTTATQTETETEDNEEDDEKTPVGDYPYTRWLPASVSTVDGSVNFEMWYVDAAEIRSMKDSLPDSLLSGGSGEFPGEEMALQYQGSLLFEPDRIDDLILFRAPPQDTSESGTAVRVYLGAFDKQRIVGTLEDSAGTQTEYGEFTLLRTSEYGDAIGISESVVIAAPRAKVKVLETFADAAAGETETVHEADAKVARLLKIIRADTFVRITYGEMYMNRSTGTPEGMLGTGIGWRIGKQETDKVFAFPFIDESSASAASDSEDFIPEENRDFELSESVDGSFVIARQTIPTAELDRFPGF